MISPKVNNTLGQTKTIRCDDVENQRFPLEKDLQMVAFPDLC